MIRFLIPTTFMLSLTVPLITASGLAQTPVPAPTLAPTPAPSLQNQPAPQLPPSTTNVVRGAGSTGTAAGPVSTSVTGVGN